MDAVPFTPLTADFVDDIIENVESLSDGSGFGSGAVQTVLMATYPVGSIYINASVATSPSILFGFGTWENFGAGRVLVGIDSADTDFDTQGETGGHKSLQSHIHTVNPPNTDTTTAGNHSHTYSRWSALIQNAVNPVDQARFIVQGEGSDSTSTAGNHSHSVDIAQFNSGITGSGTSGNLQPYIVVNMWRRIS